MPKCKNDVLLAKIGLNKLDKNTEVDFSVQDELPECKRIMANTYVSTSVDKPTFNPFRRPVNRFECDDPSCMTGTLSLGEAGNAVYKVQASAKDFAAGVITFYTQKTGANQTVTVSISDTKNFTDADEYEVSITDADVKDDGYVPVVIDLSQTPTNVVGNGWTPSEYGAFIKIASNTPLVVSSLSVFDSMEDFEISDVVKVGCISGIDGTDDIEAAEANCNTMGYDRSTAPVFERTITGTRITPNYWKLNPFMKKGEATKGFIMTTISKKVEASANNQYGVITLTDMSDDCGFMTVTIEDNCNVTDAHLERLSVPTLVALDENQYVVIDGEDGVKTVYFNSYLIGVQVVIGYPQIKTVEERIADFDNVGTRKVKMGHKIVQSDNITVYRVYNNVLITSFPNSLSEDETEFSFTISIQMDNDGHYYKDWIIRE